MSEPSPDFVFFAKRVDHIREEERRFNITNQEVVLLNPDTKTLLAFRTKRDKELTLQIYRHVSVYFADWNCEMVQGLFHSSNDSQLFLRNQSDTNDLMPLYEPRMTHQFDHRFSTYFNDNFIETTKDEHQDLFWQTTPRYWVNRQHVVERLRGRANNWVLTYRRISRSTDERTLIATIVPTCCVNENGVTLFQPNIKPKMWLCLAANFNSLVIDYALRQRDCFSIPNSDIRSLPTLSPSHYTSSDIATIAPRVLELVYTAYDLRPFAQDLWEWEIGSRQSEEQGVGNGQLGVETTANSQFPTPETTHLRKLFIDYWEQSHGKSIHTILPRLESLARSHESGGNVLSADQNLPEGRTVRHDQSDTPGSSVSTGEHRGGVRAGTPTGIHSLSTNRAGVTQGSGDSPDTFDTSRTYDERVYRAIADAMRDGWQNPERLDSLVTEQGLGNGE